MATQRTDHAGKAEDDFEGLLREMLGDDGFAKEKKIHNKWEPVVFALVAKELKRPDVQANEQHLAVVKAMHKLLADRDKAKREHEKNFYKAADKKVRYLSSRSVLSLRIIKCACPQVVNAYFQLHERSEEQKAAEKQGKLDLEFLQNELVIIDSPLAYALPLIWRG